MIKENFTKLLNFGQNNQQMQHHSSELLDEAFKGPLTGEFTEDWQRLKAIFERSSDIIFHEIQLGENKKGGLIYVDGLVDIEVIDHDLLKPLHEYSFITLIAQPEATDLQTFLKEKLISASQIQIGSTYQELTTHILNGAAIVLLDGCKQALLISAPGWEMRSIEEPATEAVIRGSREGFTENLRTNTSLLRRRLRTPILKMEPLKLGRYSNTNMVISYMEGIADPNLLSKVKEKVSKIRVDAVLESGYVEELIDEYPFSVFPQVNHTERPDKVAANLLEGKIAILIDNTPFALLMPVSFFEMLQAADDYYQRYILSTVLRVLRFIMLAIALLFPSLYIAITTFHHEMIPTTLLLSVASGRETVPFPAFIEALIMEVSFEALREAGLRLPKSVGQAVSIVGALVIGQAAVQAGIVSAAMVIVVSITGISSFIFPSYSQGIAIRLLRFPMMVFASTLGLYGILVFTLILLIHMGRIHSFGVPYLTPIAPLSVKRLKDIYIRAPWWAMGNHIDPSQGEETNNKSAK